MEAQRFTDAARQYKNLMFHLSYTMLRSQADCADAVQEALLRAWNARGSLRGEENPKAWLLRILVNVCNDMLRKRKRRPVPLEEDVPAPQVDNLPLYDALDRLEVRLRLPIVLFYLDGLRVDEIAKVLGIPSGTVKGRMMRGRKQLARMLGEKEELPCSSIERC